jgi:hypothetical protein
MSKTWGKSMKDEFHYDERGNLILENSSYWRNCANDWIINYQHEWEYNEKGENILFIHKLGGKQCENSLEIFSKDEYFYDDNGNLASIVDYLWDKENNVWKKSSTKKFFYSKKIIVQRNE